MGILHITGNDKMKEMTLKDIQQVCLDILKDVHAFCIENSIKYSLCYGTLIGAIRHQGFIPWDDDIDILMSRPEYERFVRSYKSSKGYKLFAAENNDGDTEVSVPFARVCEMQRTFVDTGILPWVNKKTGVWIDVFPIDGAPDTEAGRQKQMVDVVRQNKLLNILRIKRGYRTIWRAKTIRFQVRLLIKKVLTPFVKTNVLYDYINMCKEYSFSDSNIVVDVACPFYREREYHKKDVMKDFLLHPFEDNEFYIMTGYNEYLEDIYGDYMQLPPVEKRTTTHTFNTFYWL